MMRRRLSRLVIQETALAKRSLEVNQAEFNRFAKRTSQWPPVSKAPRACSAQKRLATINTKLLLEAQCCAEPS
ncbi:hypothetical protein PF002_g26998 [Phytophthora fragariae]|uniref:Uncharacterized protein n=1 Tax=Phytophthora fragariae TaxID=53985 RepID=A0A6A3DWB4_9STRA|nr:hypothetical protein PF009_g26181 [Phytophthora fragariae]KAE9182389.1 hypothetical protein PF002_g26998 [Phytophthora fragariae]